jgi:hypothetical protein
MLGATSACLLFLQLGAGPDASAQQPAQSQVGAIRQACGVDYEAHCAHVPMGGGAALACLRTNATKLSPPCQAALQGASGKTASPGSASAASTAAATNPAPASAQPVATAWPHAVTLDNGGSAMVYQPQVISWPDRRTLNTRIAIGITPPGARNPIHGAIEVAFTTDADLASRTVTLTDPRLVSTRFPSVDTAQAAQFEERIRMALGRMGNRYVPLDTLLVSLRGQPEKPPAVEVRNDPPAIFASARPASLVVFDGEPVLAPVSGTRLSFAVNTNWDVFFDAGNSTWYLLGDGFWLGAPDARGPWTPAGTLPAAFSALPDDANFSDVKKQVPGRRIAAKDAPTIFVSTVPAEIILTSGTPSYQAIPGTSLQYIANSDAAVFRNTTDGRFYYLVSGRWFSAPTLAGPWTFATANLPPDFARIPPDGPRGFVLASVPGTLEAQEALLHAQIPQQATLSRETAAPDVAYAGPPKFEPVAGTPLTYAVNTSFDVLRAGDVHYACWQGAWFTAPTPNGPWVLAATVPDVIYTIPPSNPLYRVTYVRVYAATPVAITYGYTAGYTMGYVSNGVVVYGTGWYYPPVIYPAPIPIYYPYPYSYAGATYYNPATGAWARGGAIYGPYGGVVKGGTAYNPNTGAWARGGAVYGPNGGAGAFSAYNPSTGSYAHGSAVWGPNGASGNASWYNARTGVSGTTQQNSNAYGRWGSSTVSGPNQTVHTQSRSGAQGSAGSFASTSGAKGAAVSGAGGNTAGAVKTAGGDVYAGADGNVYKKTSDGWQKYDNGSWNSVQKPAQQNAAGARASAQTSAEAGSAARAAPTASGAGIAPNERAAGESASVQRTAAASGGGREGFDGMGQLEGDRQARTMGAERHQQFQGGSRGFAGRGGGGHARR